MSLKKPMLAPKSAKKKNSTKKRENTKSPKTKTMHLSAKQKPQKFRSKSMKPIKTAKKPKKRIKPKTKSFKTEVKPRNNTPNKHKKIKKKHVQNVSNDNDDADDIWNAYILKYGAKPENVTFLLNFSRISPKYEPLSYRDAKLLFDKFNKQNKVKPNKKERNNKYIKRDIKTAKDRLSQRLSKKVKTDININDIIKEKPNDEDEKKEDINPTMVEVQKFLESERVYVYDGLRVGIETFLKRLEVHIELKKPIISENEIYGIFGNYRMLYNVNDKLYDDLKKLRLNDNLNELIYNLGQKMVDFIPYFKMYTDYIVHEKSAISYLEKIKKTNKRFREFMKMNELCIKNTGKTLKSLLVEPAHRIPQYLQYFVNIYTSYKHEINYNINKTDKGHKLLLQCISDIKRVSDEIAIKCRDLRARLLVGTLQRELFANKIKLLSPHRICVAHSSMDIMLTDTDQIKLYKFILFNDIFVIATFPSKFKSGHLIAAHPLIGLRISKCININLPSLTSKKYKFSLLPLNIIIIFEEEQKMKTWIETIQNEVDKQEHCMNQCNIVDLEKRLRKQKTSKEGQSETIPIKNPERIKEIQRWKRQRSKTLDVSTVKLKTKKNDKKPKLKSRPRPKPPKKKKVHVMRDEEVLQFDEEIPMENFLNALNSGFVKITNEAEQNEEYRKAVNTATKLVNNSLSNYRKYVTDNEDEDDDDSDWDESDSDDDWD